MRPFWQSKKSTGNANQLIQLNAWHDIKNFAHLQQAIQRKSTELQFDTL